jgi:hypothetical protein
MVETSLDIYKDTVPIGYPYKSAIETWAFSGTKTELKAEPEDSYILFVKRIRFAMLTTTTISAGKLHLKHSDAQSGSATIDIEISDPSDLLLHAKECQIIEFPSGTSKHYGYIELAVPARCRQSTGKSFSIVDDGVDAWTFTAGGIDWVIEGWQVSETEYDGST